ncbi:MAG: hypothetical protein KC483_04530 [Nitrosarchaeum sp.]|nr:hypothetical protein [Nitrosarchaeum sp.]MCA9819894.1 hypothetical protein [Nitrosarchaeum sp.]
MSNSQDFLETDTRKLPSKPDHREEDWTNEDEFIGKYTNCNKPYTQHRPNGHCFALE